MNKVACAAIVLAAALLAGCASSGEEIVSVNEAARAECGRRVPPPAEMQQCIEAEEVTIREARELARLRPPPPRARPPGQPARRPPARRPPQTTRR